VTVPNLLIEGQYSLPLLKNAILSSNNQDIDIGHACIGQKKYVTSRRIDKMARDFGSNIGLDISQFDTGPLQWMMNCMRDAFRNCFHNADYITKDFDIIFDSLVNTKFILPNLQVLKKDTGLNTGS
jgi:hypothetical protein